MATAKVIFVTGFGPFAGHEQRNASWEAVKLLPDKYLHKNGPIEYEIRKLEIPVTYEAVDAVVTKIWNDNPALVIHVGVHGRIDSINLEKCSYASGYCRPDFANKCLPCDKITLKSATDGLKCQLLETNLDVEGIAAQLGGATSEVKCCCSREVGSYLCGYIYLKSLDVNRDRSLFIHVPEVDRPYSSGQTKNVIQQVLEKCMEQLDREKKL